MKKNWKKMILTAAALASLALFAGCTKAAAVSVEEAKALVQQTVGAPNAVVVELESDRDDGVYELEVIVDGVGYEYEVDSRTGQIREVDREGAVESQTAATDPAPTQPTATQPAAITLEEAKDIAYAHAGVSESDAYDRSYERDDGVYEIDFDYDGWEYEYRISPTGEVLSSRKDRDDDHHTHHDSHSGHHTAAAASAQTTRISASEALAIALEHAGVTDPRDETVEWDDGRWEVSFESGFSEYEYDLSADGTILRWEKDTDG